MRKYDLNYESQKLLIPNIVKLMTMIHEYKGKQNLYIESKRDVLTSLLDSAKIHSTEYSNKIEGIGTSDQRIKELINDKVEPKTRNEEEIIGYRDVLKTIHENYEHISINSNTIRQLHRDLYQYSPNYYAGKFKTNDNVIEETDQNGNTTIRFIPVSAFETPYAIDALCESYNKEIKKGEVDTLLLISIFIIDFLSIHPFSDGNGRMSRLLTLLLLYKNGYLVGKYISIEKIVENSKESYYDSLKNSSTLWHENTNEYRFFVEYYLGVILKAYKDFSERVEYITNEKLSVKERVQVVIEKNIAAISKKEIAEVCPDINIGSIERSLTQLVKENSISKINDGRLTKYIIKNRN